MGLNNPPKGKFRSRKPSVKEVDALKYLGIDATQAADQTQWALNSAAMDIREDVRVERIMNILGITRQEVISRFPEWKDQERFLKVMGDGAAGKNELDMPIGAKIRFLLKTIPNPQGTEMEGVILSSSKPDNICVLGELNGIERRCTIMRKDILEVLTQK